MEAGWASNPLFYNPVGSSPTLETNQCMTMQKLYYRQFEHNLLKRLYSCVNTVRFEFLREEILFVKAEFGFETYAASVLVD